MKKLIHVAVGVIFDCAAAEQGKILIAKRAEHQHQGGLWEFPGGKVEPGESVQVALQRELEEELGLQSSIENMQPLITIPFHYPDKSVLLDVWKVYAAELELNQQTIATEEQAAGIEGQSVGKKGQSVGKEGQPLVWIEQHELPNYEFPAANKAILDALSLPAQIAITQDSSNPEVILAQAAKTLKNYPQTWIQLRAPSLDQMQYTQLGMRLYGICHEAGSKLIWNCPLAWYQIAFADGLHLSGQNFVLANITERPIPAKQWFSLACHNLAELESAQNIADYVLVSPVKETQTHPQANPLTWAGFKVITRQARIPCYALGGLQLSDREETVLSGGQGVAGISCCLPESSTSRNERIEFKENEYES